MNKKALYESIMKSVSKEVKKVLNENLNSRREVEITGVDNVISSFIENESMQVNYMIELTGEILTYPMWHLYEKGALNIKDMVNICQQYEEATGIDCDYRNL